MYVPGYSGCKKAMPTPARLAASAGSWKWDLGVGSCLLGAGSCDLPPPAKIYCPDKREKLQMLMQRQPLPAWRSVSGSGLESAQMDEVSS